MVPIRETRVTSPDVQPGDLMGAEVWYTTAAPYGNAYLVNYTLQQAATYAFNPPSGTTYVGNSAEWIVERPGVNGGLANLTNYVATRSILTMLLTQKAPSTRARVDRKGMP